MRMAMEAKGAGRFVVRKSVVVNAPQEHAFAVFTEQLGSWWPLMHYHIGEEPPETAVMETQVGGRWFERSSSGVECNWGRVLVWEPPSRVVLSWDITSDWQYDPNLGTEVEVRFIPEGPGVTRVELEHRRLERYGIKADAMRDIFDSEHGWGAVLQAYAQVASRK